MPPSQVYRELANLIEHALDEGDLSVSIRLEVAMYLCAILLGVESGQAREAVPGSIN